MREHLACVHAVVCGMKLADPDITTEPRVSLLRNPGRLMLSLPLRSPDAVRPWTCVWPPPVQRQLAEMLHRRHSIVSFRITGCSLPPACVDGGRASAPSRHSNASVRGRHRLQPKRAAFGGEVPLSQVEARNPNRSPAPPGSHGTRRSPESFSAGGAALRRHHCQCSLHHWGHVPALAGGPGDHDLDDFQTDTAKPRGRKVVILTTPQKSVKCCRRGVMCCFMCGSVLVL